jgi:hypothetical protein
MRTIKCTLCSVVVVADLFGEMQDKEIEQKILSHEKVCIARHEEELSSGDV